MPEARGSFPSRRQHPGFVRWPGRLHLRGVLRRPNPVESPSSRATGLRDRPRRKRPAEAEGPRDRPSSLGPSAAIHALSVSSRQLLHGDGVGDADLPLAAPSSSGTGIRRCAAPIVTLDPLADRDRLAASVLDLDESALLVGMWRPGEHQVDMRPPERLRSRSYGPSRIGGLACGHQS